MSGNSWVTLATNDSYSLGALVLAHSLKRVGTLHNLTVMVTSGVSASMRNQLASAFNVVQEVNILDSKDEKKLALLTRPELGVTFTKLHCWKLTQFSKCVFLDADVLVLRNCDELFEREELSAAPDVGWPDCFNSGVFVYRPSIETYNAIINLALSQGSFDGGDQGLLNQFFSDWATKDISRHLPFIYNMCSSATYSYLPAFKQFGQDVKIVHFIGSSKPWLQYLDSETRQVRPTLGSEHLQGYLQLWWDIFCNDVHSILTTDMAGLAGALSQLTLGVARSPEQSALEEHLRKHAWEHGNIDYMGRDSFDNIWRKICQTLSEPLPDPLPEQCDLPSQVSSFTMYTVPQEVISGDEPLPSAPQTQFIPSENKEIKDAGRGIYTPESKPIEEGANILQDESSSKLVKSHVEVDDNISETQLIGNAVVDQNVSSSSSTVVQSTSVLPSEQMYVVDASCLKEIDEANATVNLPGIVSSSATNSKDTQVSSCLEYSETLDPENLSQGNIVAPASCTPLILPITLSQEFSEDIKTIIPVAFPDRKPIGSIVEPSLSSEFHCVSSPEVSNIFQADTSIPRQICPPEPVESTAHPKFSPETAGLVECETNVQNVQDDPHLVEGFQTKPPLSEVQEGESKSFDTTISQVMRVIEPTPPTSPSISLVPERRVSCETNVLTIDSSIPDTPPLDSHSSKTPLGTSEVSSIASASPVPESSLPSGSLCTNDPKAPVPPKRRHRPSQRGQRGKK